MELSWAGSATIPFDEVPDTNAMPLSSAGFSVREDHMSTPLDLHTYLVKHPAATYFFRAAGTPQTRTPHLVLPGDLLVVDRALPPREGSLAVAVMHGRFTLVWIGQGQQGLLLYPIQPKAPPLPFLETMEDITLWGIIRHIIASPW